MFSPEAFRSLLEASGAGYRENSKSYIFDSCPRCSKGSKLFAFKHNGNFVCFHCREESGFIGRGEFLLSELTGQPVRVIRAELYGESGADVDSKFFSVSLTDFFGDEDPQPHVDVESKALQFPLDFYPIDHTHSATGRAYLADRNVPLELALRYGLMYAPLQHRVIIPNYVGGVLRGWQARYTLPHKWYDEEAQRERSVPKVLTTGPKDSILGNQDSLTGADEVVVTEGPFDALACACLGVANVFTMGKGVGAQQLRILSGSGVRKVYLGFDLDAGAEMMKLMETFSDYNRYGEPYEVYQLKPAPGYEDLGAMVGVPELVKRQKVEAERLRPGQLLLSLSDFRWGRSADAA